MSELPHWIDVAKGIGERFESPNRSEPNRGGRPPVTAPGLKQMRESTPEGQCPFCLDPLPEGQRKTPKHCGDAACERAYHRTGQRDRRRKKRSAAFDAKNLKPVQGGFVDGRKYP